jgi:hypothetical protein
MLSSRKPHLPAGLGKNLVRKYIEVHSLRASQTRVSSLIIIGGSREEGDALWGDGIIELQQKAVG